MEITNAVVGFSSRYQATGDVDALQSVGASRHRYLGHGPTWIRYYAVAYLHIPDYNVTHHSKDFIKADIHGREAYIEVGDAATAKVAKFVREEPA